MELNTAKRRERRKPLSLCVCGEVRISEMNTACYAKLAHAWINDQDAEEGKAKRYFEFIVK